MLAAAIVVCRALQCVSHLTSKPKRDFHETVVGFSEQRPIGLTVKIAHVPEIAASFHDLPEDFVNIEQIHRPGTGERTIACNVLLCFLNISSEHFEHAVRGITERFHWHDSNEWTCKSLIVIRRICSRLVAEHRSGPWTEPAQAVHQ